MTGRQFQKLRQSLGENTAKFGKRFNVSGRTVEDWEQDRCQPNKWVLPQIKELANQVKQQQRK